MKNIIIYSLLIIGTVTNAFAQKDAQAKAILNPISQKYRSYKAIKSDFTFILENSQENTKAIQNGTLIVEPKSNKFKITLYSPGTVKPEAEQEIISDGKSLWTYIKKDKEVQQSNAGNSSETFNPAQIFTIYEHGYKYLYTGDKKQDGKVYQVVDLSPENDKIPFFKIRLMIDKVKKQIYSALIFDKNGNKYNYVLKTFTPNPPVTDETFTFDPKAHPGVEVVDLR
ncbi:MAG: Outer rane lipoproteinsorting protein [Mucilaginibacter sp.]|nr:Outer rane lipoproteinsorting protein [Mucilaginibacter sp.]